MQKDNFDIENGRSMIEMLGVLAIIGVLSVGGIAGYSKAMHRYRVNKTIEQITYVAGAVRSFFATQRDYTGLSAYCTDTERANGRCMAMKAKLVPDEMWESGKNQPQHVWGGMFGFSTEYRTVAENNQRLLRAFSIGYLNLRQEACIDLVSQDWSDIGVNMIRVYNGKNPDPNLNRAPLYLPTPISIETAIRACSTTADDIYGANDIKLYFDVDVNDAASYAAWIAETNTLLNGS